MCVCVCAPVLGRLGTLPGGSEVILSSVLRDHSGRLSGTHIISGIKLRLASCKSSNLTLVLHVQLPLNFLFWWYATPDLVLRDYAMPGIKLGCSSCRAWTLTLQTSSLTLNLPPLPTLLWETMKDDSHLCYVLGQWFYNSVLKRWWVMSRAWDSLGTF